MEVEHGVRFLRMGVFFVFLAYPFMGQAVLFYSTGDPAYNTNAPTGDLEDSGWQFQGRFRNTSNDKYLGTPISAHHFITARHISSPAVGEPLLFDGVSYPTVAKTHLTDCDLTVWEIAGSFPQYAAIYIKTINQNDPLVAIGRGTRRGDAVYANGDVKGWKWGAKDFVVRWGQNLVSDTLTLSGAYGSSEPVIKVDFDSSGVTNECMLSDKDSGGALFIKDSDDGVWKLAGIHSYVSPNTFSENVSYAPTFNAAIFDYSFKVSDAEKLYYGVGQYAQQGGSVSADYPVSFYSSHIAAHITEIQIILGDAYDEDADGLPDWWELEHGIDETSMVATNDLDNDQFTNYEEWLADTVPTNDASFLALGPFTNASEVVFSSSTNREYQIQYRLDLAETNELWTTEVDWFTGTGPAHSEPVLSASSNRFYRLRARLR